MAPRKKTMELHAREIGLPLGESVFRALREAFRDGVYRPGDRLREEEVAGRLDVSRTPVREAFGRLLEKGLIRPASGRGVIVRALDVSEILELYAMREILEGAAARLAARYANVSEVELLHDLNSAIESLKDAAEMAKVNRAFHEAIFRAARNRYLDRAHQELQDGIALLGATTFSVGGRPGRAAEEHKALVIAIAQHEADKAEKLARSHIQAALKARLKLVN